MPLLRRQPFHKQKPPPNLRPDEEVFHCKLTNEVFRDYEEFFERIILCNSLVWSCCITGRSGLTYQEALDSEEKARKNLSAFPKYLQRPILILASLTYRTRLIDLNEDVFSFAKDRYFIGEIVDVMVGTVRKSCRILKVVSPLQQSQGNGDVIVIDIDSDSDDDHRGPSGAGSRLGPLPDKYEYVVQELKQTNVMTVPASAISRKRTLYTREKSKLFLKHHADSSSGVFRVKEKVVKRLNLQTAKFEDFFSGPPPVFEKSEMKKKISPKRPENRNSTGNTSLTTPPNKKRGRKKKDDRMMKEKRSPKEMKTPEQLAREQMPHLTPEERAQLKEKMKQDKMAEKMAKKEELRKRMEEERMKKREEKAKEREKMREERLKEIEILREKNRPRDDMECDDLKVMPNFKPVQTRVPMELFGDAVMVLEFIHTFKSLFDFKQFFPKGFSWGMLESALLDHDVDGPMCDLVQMLLVTVFTLQEEEAEEVEELDKEDQEMTMNEEAMEEDMTANQMILAATMTAQIPQMTHGMPLKKMLLDQFTLTEILRIHLASSGARASMKNARFRYQQRGGYTSLDDAGFELKMQEPALIKALTMHSLFDLIPGEKLRVLNTLVQQILSYAAARDIVEESYEKLRLMKYDLKQLQWAEQRREREDAQAKYRQRQEEKQRERERKIQKILEREQQLKAEESGNGAVNGDVNEPKTLKNKLLLLDEDRNTPSPDLDDDNLTEEEKQRRRKKEEDEEAKKKADFAKKEEDMVNKILELQRTNALYPVGRDRMYRRYWVFHALPGLFVEDNEVNVDPEVLDPFSTYLEKHTSIPHLTSVDEKNTSSDKENDSMNTSVDTSVAENVVQPATDPRVKALKKDEEVIVISDSDSESRTASKDGEMEVDEPPVLDDEPPPALESLAAQQISNRKKTMWSFLDTSDQLNELLDCLNSRGFRERELKQSLFEIKSTVVKSIHQCPVEDLSLPPDAMEEARVKALALTRGISGKKAARGTVQNDTAQEAIELNLRDTLLDLEDRIYAGSLGYMKIKDRAAWRDAIEQGSYFAQNDDPVFARQKTEAHDYSDLVCTEAVVRDLSRALLQVARGLEPKYLGVPLGESDEAKKKRLKAEKEAAEKRAKRKDKAEVDSDDEDKDDVRQQKTTYERWEESLLSVTNLSQVFLFLSTLDKSIIWSKSALHARCRICRRKGDGEKMLLCDGCDRGHHMYCLKPPVEKVPTGDWYCPNCKPKEVKRSPRKDRRKTFEEEEQEVEEEENDDEEEEEEEDSDAESEEEEVEEEEEDENENLCVKCNKPGMLLCCDSCPGSYHLTCADPPLKKVPRGKWLCQVCLGVDKPGGKIKLVHKKKNSSSSSKKTTPGRGTPNSSRPSSRRGSPRDSPVPTKPRRSHPVSEEKPKMQKKTSTSRLSQDAYADMDGSPKHYVSSYRGNSTVQQMKHLEDIVHDLAKMDDAWPFLKPVSKKMVPDYYDVIDKPMDFSTIRNRINKFVYKKPADLISDVRQIFFNCIEYNNRKTPEYKCGAGLSKLFESKIRDIEMENDESSPPPTKKSKK
ncbi:bromodomain adjacent to zinc finger domain protein 1A-like [Haliotis cracherodii]|uniref:bromodomain adjacent to zinc finger domain protein 1A-like n=1 Tax=Haliotis cracherodii TaxID=6455 RepID=UPI0039EC439B